MRVVRADEAFDRAFRDEEARDREEPGFAERREMLRLAVPELVRDIGRPRGNADREVREERRDEIRARVDGLGDEAEAVGREPGAELEDDERRRGGDRDER